MTLDEMVTCLRDQRGVKISRSALHHWLRDKGWSFKKTVYASEQDREDVMRQREGWKREQPDMDIERMVFIDETCLTTKMARLYGRSPRGQRCLAKIPFGHYKNTTFVGSLSLSGGMKAPFLLDGSMTGEAFKIYVGEILIPALKPCSIVVMDNLSSHKVSGIKEMLEEAGHELKCLPPPLAALT